MANEPMSLFFIPEGRWNLLKLPKIDIQDIALLFGVVAFAYGLHQVYQPASALFVGAVFIKIGMTNG